MENQKVLIGLSGGVNSMAVLCWLVESGIKPSELHLFYAHFYEHSPDTFQFVADGIRYARKHFDNVSVYITKNSVLAYFKEQKMIPHPIISPCSRDLKIGVAKTYAFNNGIEIDLVGYVKHEIKKRTGKIEQEVQLDMFPLAKVYPIGEFTDDWCFKIVQKHIGWYPFIYTIVDEKGKRIFKHNNCLPCKNMMPEDMEYVKKYYSEYHLKAMQLSAYLGSWWGRDEADFYSRFGRDLGQDSTCEACKF